MKDAGYLIVGHGLAGSVLAMTFQRRNIPFKWIGTSMPGEASIASSGLITPVTGRKYVKSWMIDELLESALDFYRWSEHLLGEKFFSPVEIVRFLAHPEALSAWQKRSTDPEYNNFISAKRFEEIDRLNRPYGILTGGYRLDTTLWLDRVKNFFMTTGQFEELDQPYSASGEPETVIYATGALTYNDSPGLIPNKGEALVVRMPEWQFPAILKEELFVVPLRQDDLYWVGSYYEPWPEDGRPSPMGRAIIVEALEKIYKGSFSIISHLSGIRPTVKDRRPLVGSWPGHPGKYMFNGMGTKGTSLAPYWAAHLLNHLTEGAKVDKLVDPARFITQQSG
jgi:glycine/D-amino acid oxidase-like deaminating enzyme